MYILRNTNNKKYSEPNLRIKLKKPITFPDILQINILYLIPNHKMQPGNHKGITHKMQASLKTGHQKAKIHNLIMNMQLLNSILIPTDCRAAQPQLLIIFNILMCINRIINNGPTYTAYL